MSNVICTLLCNLAEIGFLKRFDAIFFHLGYCSVAWQESQAFTTPAAKFSLDTITAAAAQTVCIAAANTAFIQIPNLSPTGDGTSATPANCGGIFADTTNDAVAETLRGI